MSMRDIEIQFRKFPLQSPLPAPQYLAALLSSIAAFVDLPLSSVSLFLAAAVTGTNICRPVS